MLYSYIRIGLQCPWEKGKVTMKRLVCILTFAMLIFAISCNESTPAPAAVVPDDNTATRIIEAYNGFLSYIESNQADNRLSVSGDFNPTGFATVIADITNEGYTYKKGSYASLNANGDAEISMRYIKVQSASSTTMWNTICIPGWNSRHSRLIDVVITTLKS